MNDETKKVFLKIIELHQTQINNQQAQITLLTKGLTDVTARLDKLSIKNE
jgi:hypothetical protein